MGSDGKRRSCYFPKRYIVTILLFLGMLIVHAQRVNVAVTVVTILDKTAYEKVGSVEAMTSVSCIFDSLHTKPSLHI